METTDSIILTPEEALVASIHKPDSVYFGLSVSEQKLLSKIRRGGKKIPKSVLRQWKRADKGLYSLLLQHCIKCLIHASENDAVRLDRVWVYLRLPINYRAKARGNIGRAVVLAYEDYYVYVRYSVDSVVNYLHSIGESTFDSKSLRKELWNVRKSLDELEWLNDVSIPLCWVEKVDALVEEAPELRANRRTKGRGKFNLYRKKKVVDKSSNS